MAETGPGRPTLFTEEIRQKIIKAVRGGNYDYIAAEASGVSRRTLAEWRARGRKEKSGEYYDFLHALMVAEKDAETEAVEGVRNAARCDPKHWYFWLERKCPERWGRDTYQIKQMQKELEALKHELRSFLDSRNTKSKKTA